MAWFVYNIVHQKPGIEKKNVWDDIQKYPVMKRVIFCMSSYVLYTYTMLRYSNYCSRNFFCILFYI